MQVIDVELAEDDDKKWDADTKFSDLPTKKFSISQLPAAVGQLQHRMLKEFDTYFPEASNRQCLAIALDSVMMTTGLSLLAALGYTRIVDRCRQVPIQAVKDEALHAWQSSTAPPITVVHDDNSSDDDHIKKAMRARLATVVQASEESYTQIAEEALKSWT